MITNDAAMRSSVIRDLLYTMHANKYFPHISVFNNEEIDCI